MLVILLASLLFLREPRLQRYDEGFLRWLLRNSPNPSGSVPLTVVEIGGDQMLQKKQADQQLSGRNMPSPVELALFLQAALEFKPTVVAFESVLQWRDRNKDQEQIFLDQAMHVPKMLVAAELTATPDLDAPVVEIPSFPNVTGRRGALPEFSGISRQPDEDIRLLSTLGYINLPGDVADEIHVPLLFQYRGEVIPSFSLQTALLWMRMTPAEVKIFIGVSPEPPKLIRSAGLEWLWRWFRHADRSYILLPDGREIPMELDGTALIAPHATARARQLNLNELLLAAQQHENRNKPGGQAGRPEEKRDDIILARISDNQSPATDVFAAAIATIQSNSFVRRVTWIFDCVFILSLVVVSSVVRRFSRIDIVLLAIALTAAYCLSALAVLSRWYFWMPGVLPLSAVWLVAAFSLFAPRRKDDIDLPSVAPPPPSL